LETNLSKRLVVSAESIPKLVRHAKFRFDKARDKWIILAPERVFELDDVAYEVISRCDNERSVEQIVDNLCEKFDQVSRDVILTDVTSMLQNLADKGFVVT